MFFLKIPKREKSKYKTCSEHAAALRCDGLYRWLDNELVHDDESLMLPRFIPRYSLSRSNLRLNFRSGQRTFLDSYCLCMSSSCDGLSQASEEDLSCW